MTAPVTQRQSGPDATSSCGDAAPVCGPEPAQSTAPPATTATNAVKRAAEEPSRVDSKKAREERKLANEDVRTGELALRKQVSQLRPGDVMHAEVEGSINLKVKGGAHASATVERQDDGTFIVELKGGAEAGLGKAATLGAEVGTRFHLQTSEGVADLLQAAGENGLAGVLSQGSPWLQAVLSWRSTKTLAQHAEKNMEVASLQISAKTSLDWENELAGQLGTKVGAGLTGSVGAEIDWAKGELTVHQALSVDAVARIRGPIISAVNIGADAKVTAKLEGKLVLTEQMKADLKEGRLKPEDLLGSVKMGLKVEADEAAYGEILVGGAAARVKVEAELPLSDLWMLAGSEADRKDLLSRTTIEANVYTRQIMESWTTEVRYDGNGGGTEFRIDRRRATISANALEITAWLQETVRGAAADEVNAQNTVTAQRAFARMRR